MALLDYTLYLSRHCWGGVSWVGKPLQGVRGKQRFINMGVMVATGSQGAQDGHEGWLILGLRKENTGLEHIYTPEELALGTKA